jgi:hypothetical protein
MADSPETFMARWSRRKRSPRDTDDPAEPADSAVTDATDAGAAVADDPASDDPAAGDPEVIAKLPDIDSLDGTSDFKPFLAKGVPEALRRQALRKLWRLNPVFAQLDGLNDYDENYTLAATAVTELKTLYRVGKGMLRDDEPKAQAAEAEPAGEEPEGGGDPVPAESAAAPAADPPGAPTPEDGEPAADDGRSGAAPEPSRPAELAALTEDRGGAVERPAEPARPRRRQAASRRWGDSSQ